MIKNTWPGFVENVSEPAMPALDTAETQSMDGVEAFTLVMPVADAENDAQPASLVDSNIAPAKAGLIIPWVGST